MPLFSKQKAEPDPNPGIGGYDYPRGPYGATGFKGSTSDVRNNPPAADSKLHDNYNGHKPRRKWQTLAYQQSRFNQDNWDIPVNPDAQRDTEQRNHGVISTGTPGNERQRNTVYQGGRKAQPGITHQYRSSPNPAKGSSHGQVVEQENRYVFNGVNGGTDLYQGTLSARRMPYTGQHGYRGRLGHARGGIRGAVNDGTRFFQGPPIMVSQGGAYGFESRGKVRHRPTIFREPSPWTSQFYDTTRNIGTPDAKGANTQVVSSVHVSPVAAARRNRGF